MAKIRIDICCGLYCAARGGQELLDLLESDRKIIENCTVNCVECTAGCEDGKLSPIIIINDIVYNSATAEQMIDVLYKLIEQGG
jgi:NADH:ubiquinone oxidoreductase subunit E